jgi:GTP-binding protein HflX
MSQQRFHETVKQVTERVLLVGLLLPGVNRNEHEDTMNELAALSETAEAEVLGRVVQNLKHPHAGTYVGKGKLEEISREVNRLHITTLIINDNLSPSQARNIAEATKCNVVDRTELILDIFAKHAHTGQARMQVELAQLEYNYSRLRNLWGHFSRIEGGIGFRGPGETQIELDRREIRRKIALLKERIAENERITHTKRNKRRNYLSVSVVGYTNAGKTTLFNRLTNENAYAADKLFATLESTSRALDIDSPDPLILTDTIGFIRKLPHTLVSSFHSTLAEVMEADLLLHVVDVAQPSLKATIDSVESVLKELGCEHKNTLMVFNKNDLLTGVQAAFLRKRLAIDYPDHVFISAVKDENLDPLLYRLHEFMHRRQTSRVLHIPVHMTSLVGFIHRQAEVIGTSFDADKNEHLISVRAPLTVLESIEHQVEKEYYRYLPDGYPKRHARRTEHPDTSE